MANNGDQNLAGIRDDMSKLREDVNAALRGLMDSGKTRAGALKDKGAEMGRRAIDTTETQIKERPFLSVLMVFLIGMLLGKIVDQRIRG